MPIGKKQLLRLIRLVAQLKENRYPNCSSFASDMRKADLDENLNVSCTPKTIFRDIQTLKSDFDAPIEFDKTRNGYYLTKRNWSFSCPQTYDDSEMLAAVLGARIAEHIFPQVMQKQIRNAVDNLLTRNNPDFLDKTQIDSLVILPENRTNIAEKVFMPLFNGWQNHCVCHIAYKDSKGNVSERDFEPHTLVYLDGVWYSKGFCRTRQEARTLVLPRMSSVTLTDKFFIESASEEGIFDPEMVENVVVQCDEYLANIIPTRPLHPEQKVIPNATGCELRVKKMSKYRLVTWIMHQCGRATIISPKNCAEEIKEFADKLLTNHQS